MNKKKILGIFLSFVIILWVLTISISKNGLNKSKYSDFIKKNNISDSVGLSSDKLILKYNNLIDYINFGKEELIKNDFNNREVLHMKDVYNLFKINTYISYFTGLITLAYLIYMIKFIFDKRRVYISNIREKSILFKYTYKSMIFIIIICLILAFIISVNFEKSFIIFHKLLFNNDLWLLNPETDIMIRMLPQEYFMNLGYSIFLQFALILSFFIGISWFASKDNKK